MTGAVVVAARRTPIARLDGDLAPLAAEALGATVVRDLAAALGEAAAGVDDVIFATAAGPGGNLARRVALEAGLSPRVPGLTIDRQCGGGLDAVILACRLVQAGAGRLYVAGGVESASTSPLRSQAGIDARAGGRSFFPRRMFSGGGHDDPGMAESAETVAAELGVGRDRQDAFAAASHARAAAARDAGAFGGEIVPVDVPGSGPVRADSCPRPGLTPERLARFPAVVRPGGTVTAGNASQIADGAAAAVVASAGLARELGLPGIGLVDACTAGVDPRLCGMGGAAAVRMLRARNPELDPAAVAQVAFTEAFASQAIATIDDLELDGARVNPSGGAIGLGHPWGASGAVQVVRLHADLAGRNGEQGLALAAIAGGMGTAAWFVAGEP